MNKKTQTTSYELRTTKRLRVAIVCDWLIGGGAEKVVLELHRMYPKAPIYTSCCTDEWRKKLGGKVITGYLQNWPFSALRKYIPYLRGWWFSSLKLDGYDLIISSSGAEAKFIKVGEGTTHIVYIHAPTHYYWARYDEYLKHPGFGFFDPLARLGLKLLVGPMRRWDFRAAQRPDYLIANSNYTKSQIKKYYERDSVVIHPPVDTERFQAKSQKPKAKSRRSGFVIAGRQTPYKRFDLAVAACTELNVPLKVIGDGSEHNKLVKIAGPRVMFLGRVPEDEVPRYLQQAEAFIFPSLDDFGVVAVEAMAAGAPVIAYKAGGALDYMIPGKTGLFFDNQTVASLSKAVSDFGTKKFSSEFITGEAKRFSEKIFQEKIIGLIDKNS